MEDRQTVTRFSKNSNAATQIKERISARVKNQLRLSWLALAVLSITELSLTFTSDGFYDNTGVLFFLSLCLGVLFLVLASAAAKVKKNTLAELLSAAGVCIMSIFFYCIVLMNPDTENAAMSFLEKIPFVLIAAECIELISWFWMVNKSETVINN